ncbi:MAG TPA: gamma-glutamyl-gamma-aminobutyrate hydrolase family protein [Gemmatimonadaceae bacterium]|nr:gamma-glutamyl-gamma-aminobutyrate hydrolase family protein [Gemmatimonadaceae bacterium]
MTAPIVALTSTTKEIDGAMRVRLNEAYVNAVRAAGLIPLVLPPLAPNEAEAVLSTVAGVILTGGEDVDPVEFGAARHPRTQTPHVARDKCELAVVKAARALSLPTLGICRGIQAINVALGGTLIQDIPSERPSAVVHDQDAERGVRVHTVELEPDSLLADAIGAAHITVNSYHHQAVDRLADGLRVTARAEDGIVEGVESTDDDWWMLAVQWHPEELVGDGKPWDRGLFRAFAQAVAAAAESRGPRLF